MLGGDEEKDPDAAKKEEERQEALRQEEEERKAKYAKMEAEREVMRQGIRDKVRARGGRGAAAGGPLAPLLCSSRADPGVVRREGHRPPGSPHPRVHACHTGSPGLGSLCAAPSPSWA